MDSPRWQDPPTHSVLVQGWVAVPRAAAWEGPFVDVGELRPLELVQRAEVEAGFGDEWHVTGYQTIVPITPETASGRWSVVLRVDGREYREVLDVDPSAAALDEFRDIKRKKLERLDGILRCPRPVDGRTGADDCRGELGRVDAPPSSAPAAAPGIHTTRLPAGRPRRQLRHRPHRQHLLVGP